MRALVAHQARQAAERQRRGAIWDDLDLVFPNTIGRPISPQNLLRRDHYPLLAAAGLPRVRFHDLRHTLATLLLGRGVHPKVVSEMLGHTDVGITLDLYSHVTATMQHDAGSTTRPGTSTRCLVVNLVVRSTARKTKPQVSPRSSGDRATVS